MSLWWLYTILAIAAALTIAGIIILVGRQSEERGGYLEHDTADGARPRTPRMTVRVRRRHRLSAHARAHAQPLPLPPVDEAERIHAMFEQIPLHGDGEPVAGYLRRAGRERHFPPPPVIRAFEGGGDHDYRELSENELAHRVATQQQPRGADAA
jgi:hypothetical protein